VVYAKPVKAITSCKCCLLIQDLRNTQIVKAQATRKVGLIVARKSRIGPRNVCPFGKALTPPLIVLPYSVKLWKIIGDEAHCGLRVVKLLTPVLK
jgi:hypothetical protein